MKGELLTIREIEERINAAIKNRNEADVNYWMGYRARAMDDKLHQLICGPERRRG